MSSEAFSAVADQCDVGEGPQNFMQELAKLLFGIGIGGMDSDYENKVILFLCAAAVAVAVGGALCIANGVAKKKQHTAQDNKKDSTQKSSTKIEPANALETSKQASATDILEEFLGREDIWVGSVLPFVGPGHFAFVAGVCKKFRNYYQQYFSSLKNPPSAYLEINSTWNRNAAKRPTTFSDTFFIVAFSTVPCAEFWDSDTKNKDETVRQRRVRRKEVCQLAAKGGSLPVLQWARENHCPWDRRTCAGAAYSGHLKILKWARENGCPWNKRTCTNAARNGHLEVLKWAHENCCPWDKWTCSGAAENGHLEELKHAHENGCGWDKWTCTNAAENGHLEILKYARANGCPWNEQTSHRAAEKGHLDVLKWAQENGCKWDCLTCAFASEHGHLETLKWAHENGCPWDNVTCACAAWCGNLEVLKYAHVNGCPWDKLTCAWAAQNGNLDVLQWAHENGCPWDEETCQEAVSNGHWKTLKWAHEKGCHWRHADVLQEMKAYFEKLGS